MFNFALNATSEDHFICCALLWYQGNIWTWTELFIHLWTLVKAKSTLISQSNT